jgi:stress-induced morphogen
MQRQCHGADARDQADLKAFRRQTPSRPDASRDVRHVRNRARHRCRKADNEWQLQHPGLGEKHERWCRLMVQKWFAACIERQNDGAGDMAMAGPDIEAMIREAFPDADVVVTDLAGDGDHFGARVVSQAFAGKSRIQQHQMVYAALKGRMGGELHALALETAVPA